MSVADHVWGAALGMAVVLLSSRTGSRILRLGYQCLHLLLGRSVVRCLIDVALGPKKVLSVPVAFHLFVQE